MSKKVTIYDIAKYLGVTTATVSYALNNVSKISEETRIKVLEAAKKLGYYRDYTAVSLSTGRTHLIALFLPFEDISKAFLENPFYGEFIGCFEKQIKKYDYDLLIEPMISEKEFLPWLRGRGVEAIAVIGSFPSYYHKAFKTLGRPTVLVDVFDDHSNDYNNVRIADKEGMYTATEYLIDNGHKRIAFISGNIETSITDRRRYDGYKEALEDHHIELDPSIIFTADVSVDAGSELAKVLMKDKSITGVICAADSIAIGIMNGYRDEGKTIPEELSIIGFDDIIYAKMAYPGLTTIKQDIGEKGRLAAKLLLDDIRNQENNNKIITLNPEL